MMYAMNKTIFLLLTVMVTTGMTACGQMPTEREQTILKVFGRLNLSVEPYDDLNWWTDDFASFRPFFSDLWKISFDTKPRASGDTIFLCGGTLHEGGYTIAILLDAAGKMKIARTELGYTKGDAVDYRTIGNETLLVISDVRTGSPKSILKKFDGSLRERITRCYRRYLLSGKYVPDRGNGRSITFSPDRESVTGFKSSIAVKYRFAEEYDTPVPILLFGKKEAYQARKILIGIELAPMIATDEALEADDWADEAEMLKVDETQPVMQYNKASEMIPGLPSGRFPLASVEVMTLEELGTYAGTPLRPNLQVMRNEIFARYGYKFKSGGEMDSYFSTQRWYIPRFDDVTDQLTDIERLNIALIQTLEREY